MSKSVEELFRNAPEEATHYAKYCHYKVIGDTWMVHISDNEWAKSDSMYNGQIKPSDIIARPKTKPWSGPEDGLPPVGQYVHVYDPEGHLIYGTGENGEVIAHVENTAVVRMSYGLGCFTAKYLLTYEQIAADKRESAIRELMDVAGVDCRVTAARLVDAGFKREGK